MKNLLTYLFLGGSLVFNSCENKESVKEEREEYTIQDTLKESALIYSAVKDNDSYLLTIKGNIDNKYSKIIFFDANNDTSISIEDYVTFYKNGNEIDHHFGYNGVVKGLWENSTQTFYNASDSSKLSQTIIKEARNQIENYFNPLYKKLRAHAEDKYKKGIGILPNHQPEVINLNQDSIINEKIKELF